MGKIGTSASGLFVDVDEAELSRACSSVERLLRLALSDWYAYLGRQAITPHVWRYEVPWWAKRVPDRFDKDWALNDLRTAVDRPGMLTGLNTAVDEVVLSLEREEEAKRKQYPDVSRLHAALKKLMDMLMEDLGWEQ